MYKAMIEGIAFELRVAKERFEKRVGHPFETIRISGGGSRSKEICQLFADIMGCPVETLHTEETSSLGAAIGGFLSLGVYKNTQEAVKAMVRVKEVYQPRKEKVEAYNTIYTDAYKDLYKALKKTYRFLYRFSAV